MGVLLDGCFAGMGAGEACLISGPDAAMVATAFETVAGNAILKRAGLREDLSE